MGIPSVGPSQLPQQTAPTEDAAPPAPLGATPVRPEGQGSGTGGTADTFAASGGKPPQYQDGQSIGTTGNGQSVVAGSRDMGNFYCEHALFSSNEFAHQPGSSIKRDGNGDPMVTFIHHPGELDREGSPDRQKGEIGRASCRERV